MENIVNIYATVKDVKRREKEDLVKALRQYGETVDNGYEVHFEDECPIIAAYDYEEPCDMVILAVRVDDDDNLTIIADEKNDRGNEHDIDDEDIFAGQMDFITDYICE